MDWLAQLDMDKFLLFTLVLTRVSGLTVTAPIYGSQEVPMQVRALLAFALAVLIVPGSIGVRESIMVMILGPVLGAPLAVIIAALARLVLTLSELVSALGFRLAQRIRPS